MSRNLVLFLYALGLAALLLFPKGRDEGGWLAVWNRNAPEWAKTSWKPSPSGPAPEHSLPGSKEGGLASWFSGLFSSGPNLRGLGNGPEGAIVVQDSTGATHELPPAKNVEASKRAKNPPVVKVSPKEKHLDKLTKTDRDELNNLFSDMD